MLPATESDHSIVSEMFTCLTLKLEKNHWPQNSLRKLKTVVEQAVPRRRNPNQDADMADHRAAPEIINLLSSDDEDEERPRSPRRTKRRERPLGSPPPSQLPEFPFTFPSSLLARPERLSRSDMEDCRPANPHAAYDSEVTKNGDVANQAYSPNDTSQDSARASHSEFLRSRRAISEALDPPEDEPGPQPGSGNTRHSFGFEIVSVGKCTLDACIVKVEELFPGIRYDYVQKLYEGRWQQHISFRSYQQESESWDPSQQIIDEILQASCYPKQKEKSRDTKRKRRESQDSDSHETSRWESAENTDRGLAYLDEA